MGATTNPFIRTKNCANRWQVFEGSYDREQGIKALHLVTAWVAEQNLTLGQIKVEDHKT